MKKCNRDRDVVEIAEIIENEKNGAYKIRYHRLHNGRWKVNLYTKVNTLSGAREMAKQLAKMDMPKE